MSFTLESRSVTTLDHIVPAGLEPDHIRCVPVAGGRRDSPSLVTESDRFKLERSSKRSDPIPHAIEQRAPSMIALPRRWSRVEVPVVAVLP